jgi:hypothetical protein
VVKQTKRPAALEQFTIRLTISATICGAFARREIGEASSEVAAGKGADALKRRAECPLPGMPAAYAADITSERAKWSALLKQSDAAGR